MACNVDNNTIDCAESLALLKARTADAEDSRTWKIIGTQISPDSTWVIMTQATNIMMPVADVLLLPDGVKTLRLLFGTYNSAGWKEVLSEQGWQNRVVPRNKLPRTIQRYSLKDLYTQHNSLFVLMDVVALWGLSELNLDDGLKQQAADVMADLLWDREAFAYFIRERRTF